MVLVKIPSKIIEQPQLETKSSSTPTSATTSKVPFLSNKKSLLEKIKKSSISSKYKCIKCKRYEIKLIVVMHVNFFNFRTLDESELRPSRRNKEPNLPPQTCENYPEEKKTK
jgi:hypothetical protein